MRKNLIMSISGTTLYGCLPPKERGTSNELLNEYIYIQIIKILN
jgi:hypothetical protein